MDYQLELTNVAKHYKDFIAVDNVDLQIKKGEIISNHHSKRELKKDGVINVHTVENIQTLYLII